MTGNNTPIRGVRVPDPLWHAAQTVAGERGESLSEVLRDKLRAYVESARPDRPR